MATGCLGNVRIIIKCILTRLLLMLHLLLLVWRVWETYVREHWYFALAGPLAFMLVELTVVLYRRNGQEWRRFCPSYFFYLMSAIPSVWFIELNRLEAIRQDRASEGNSTSTAELDFNGFKLSVTMTTTEWALAMEQTMMFLLIIGRWMLPKGDMSREQLSQLLLVYLGMAIDILELFEVFKETKVLNDKVFIYVVLSGFSWSLMQFTFLLTPPPKQKRPTRNQVVDILHVEEPEVDNLRTDKFSFIYNEKFAIFVSLIMQDLPFFIIRLVAIFVYQVFSYANTFFTVKNGIMVLLQCYRLVVLTCERLADDDNDECRSKEKVELASNTTSTMDNTIPRKPLKDVNENYAITAKTTQNSSTEDGPSPRDIFTTDSTNANSSNGSKETQKHDRKGPDENLRSGNSNRQGRSYTIADVVVDVGVSRT